MCVVQPTTPASEPSTIIVTNVMQTFSGLSQFESARVEMLEFSGLVDDIVHCTELELVPAAVEAALQTIAHLSVSSELQDALLKAGVLWLVTRILLMFYFDYAFRKPLCLCLLYLAHRTSALLCLLSAWTTYLYLSLFAFCNILSYFSSCFSFSSCCSYSN